jgi:thiol-disulfide isomerase/thioredoxin
MLVTKRRAVLAGTVALAAGTLAGAALLRKPAAQPIHTPVTPPGPPPASGIHLRGIADMLAANPPAPPPATAFIDAEGARKTLADYAGRGLIVNLWATWCAPCVAEMPALQGLARTVAAEGILVLPLSSDIGGAEAVRKFYAEHAITGLPVMLDPKGVTARAWGARGLPTTLIIDRQGREHGRLEGAVAWTDPDTIAAIRRMVG